MDFRSLFFGYAKRTVLCILMLMPIILIHAESLKAQSFDYEKAPQLKVDFLDLTVEMGIQPQNLKIDAAATYHLKVKEDSIQTIALDAVGMNISSVTIAGKDVDFTTEGGKLSITLPEMPEKGQDVELRIRYSNSPHFGVLKDRQNTVWTSLLPKSQRHWVPIIDNPQVRLKANFNISVPAEYQVWATGTKTGEEAVNDNITQYQFKSKNKVPASDISFAIGRFESSSAMRDSTKINLVVPKKFAGTTDGQALLRKSKGWIKSIEEETQSEYPYNSLNIVVLQDHHWETKSWGSSTVYLYRNRGNLEAQLLRGLIGQWAGAKSLPSRWQQADGVTLYQTLIQHAVADQDFSLEIADQPESMSPTVYDKFGTDRWNAWQQKWKNWSENPQGLFANIPPAMLQQFLLMMSGPEYSNYWNGQPLFNFAELESKKDSSVTKPASIDSVMYNLRYTYNQADGSVTLDFTAVEGEYNNPQILTVYKAYGNKTEPIEVDFSGANDSATLSVANGLRSVWINIPDNLNLKIEEEKPVSFLMYELEHARTTKQRARAARNLGSHSQNPDIQLAVNDALGGNIEPEVRAGLLFSLADITDGATGTQQDFLEALQKNSKAVQKAGLKGLQNYPENADVQNSVKRFVTNTPDETLLGNGIITFAKLSSDEELQTLLSDIAQGDSTGHRSITAVKYLAKEDMGQGQLTESLTHLLDAANSFELRSKVLNVLAKYDQSSESWLKRGKGALKESADPRIRYLVAAGMLKNRSPEITSFLQEYVVNEYDARVHQLITKALK